MTKKIIEKLPEVIKSQLIDKILEEPELLEKFGSEINK